MPSFRSGKVTTLLMERPGLQRVEVDLGEGNERAYVLTQLTGTVAVGDRVVVNTTAVELGLGTGGWHVVHWNLEREQWAERGPGHIIKGRYTSLQADVGSAEEHLEGLAEVESIEGMPVVAAALHSQLPAAAVAFKDRAPDARLAYVMTDGAGLPLALSDLAYALRERGLVDAAVTCGHAFGGDYEAVSIFSALAVARHAAEADAVVVAMGPGIVGTNTRLGFSGMEVGGILDAAAALDGQPIACLRVSFADPRARHVGVSHHTRTALRLACRDRVTVAVPRLGGDEDARLQTDLADAGIAARHDLVDVTSPDVLALLAERGLDVVSMGRPAADDPALFLAAGAAGALAAERAR
jgi:2,4-dienoyl-CoA reductase-like NADH-dependent reductase (Old Yellow Enzyme family)